MSNSDQSLAITNEHKGCIACPVEVRSLYAAAYNACNAFEQAIAGDGDPRRAMRKMAELRNMVHMMEPIVEKHFATCFQRGG